MKTPALLKIKNHFTDLKVSTVNLTVFVRAVFLGLLLAEVAFFSRVISERVNDILVGAGYEIFAVILPLLGIAAAVVYSLVRGFLSEAKKVLRSGRLDLLLVLGFGISVSIASGGLLPVWYSSFVHSLTFPQILLIILAPFLLGFSIIIRSFLRKVRRVDSTFIADNELEDRKDDLLNFTDKANRFAERVFNNGAPDSFVFGVDAPWGIGKSTFVNFCTEYCEEHHKEQTVIYKFTPLKYPGNQNLVEIFVDGLIHAIKADSFIPEIRPLISYYSRLLREANRFSIFWATFPTLPVAHTADDAFDDLTAILQRFDKKMIIIVDDLDRMRFSEIQDILSVIRKSFVLPNISYVLCYDTENIGVLEVERPDTEKVSEFLEKFVNVKISLYLDREDLARYVSDNLDKALTRNLVDPVLVRQAIGGLLDIYRSSSYHQYLPFLGDIRKLKRLVNIVVMFELERTDFKNTDFDKRDLIHLLLLYIHYPHIFRKIYDTETKDGRGFFSLVLPSDDGYPEDNLKKQQGLSESRYANSIYYTEYVEQFPKGSRQRFLLDQVFSVDVRLKRDDVYSVTEEMWSSLACFNGGWNRGRNLEAYLNLIVHLSKPEDVDQHRFYVNWKDQIAAEAKTIEDAFADNTFAYDKGEQPRVNLWRVLVNNAWSLNTKVVTELVLYLLEYIHEYSYMEIPESEIGLRHNLPLFLARLLNDVGWTDTSGRRSYDTQENIAEIAEWIFGEGRHVGNGILTKLARPDLGIPGLHDLMLFRLYCSADRGGDLFNLSRSLSLHGDENAPLEGDIRRIAREEMREISQRVFEIFKTQYIDQSKNVFEEAWTLTQKQLTGRYHDYLEEKIRNGVIRGVDVAKAAEELKSRIVSFIIYQLGNDLVSHGVGCGFYDPGGGEDRHGIKQVINDYLFDFCFYPLTEMKVEDFIDYLFRNLIPAVAGAREDGRRYIPRIDEFTRVLDEAKLACYWKKHGPAIKAMNLESKEKVVSLGNYEAPYKEYLPLIYKVLDDHVESFTQKMAASTETATAEASS